MAVYTLLDHQEINLVASEYNLGEVLRVEWVPAGSVNTNAILHTRVDRFFLRYTTVRSQAELEFECALLETLQRHQLPAAHMLRSNRRASVELRQGRACIFTFLEGRELKRAEVTTQHVYLLGQQLARCHKSLQSLNSSRVNPYGSEVVETWLKELTCIPDKDIAQVAAELLRDFEEINAVVPDNLPTGIIHADLFLDNVKWSQSGTPILFDFEMACKSNWVLDVAITLNAWCFDAMYQEDLCSRLLAGYQSVRPMTDEEKSVLSPMMRFGAIRFTASRIRDFHLSSLPADKLVRKDYRTYLERVRALRRWSPASVFDD